MTRALPRRALLVGTLGASTLGLSARGRGSAQGSGALERDPDGLVDLPPGFRYTIVERVGMPMDDGYRVPGRPDAMACFPLTKDRYALMRNHELAPGAADSAWGPSGVPPAQRYLQDGMGGVSRVVIDAKSGARLSSNLVLAGTTLNCAGGISPWGWLSCEETVAPGHGFVFLCDPKADRIRPPKRITAYGRFRHEAAVVDPKTHIAYLTEDRLDSAFYRFVPTHPDKPFVGRLQALCVSGEPGTDTAMAQQGARFDVTWEDIPETRPAQDTVRYQAQAAGAARFVRGEGLWLAGDELYFTATEGGPVGRGQVFRLNTRTSTLDVLVSSSDPRYLDMPDNLTVGPDGVVYLAEDGPGGNTLRVLTPEGELKTFARDVLGLTALVPPTGALRPFARNTMSMSEFAGVCFAPDARRMFVNVQDQGLTLAIEGPFSATLGLGASGGASGRARLPPGVLGIGIGAGTALVALAALVGRRRQREAPDHK